MSTSQACRMTVAMAVVLAVCAAACTSSDGAPDADWPQFLGPDRDGKVATEIRREWGPEGPPVLWRKSIGSGYASPSIADGRLYLFHRVGDEEIVEALDPATGDMLWRTANPTDYRDVLYGFDEGPRAAPTIVNGVVYTAGVKRFIQALDAATGERRWGFDAIERYDTRQSPFGNATQPFWVDGRIVLNIGGRAAGIVAIDAETGETAWTATDHQASYAPPAPGRGRRDATPAVLHAVRSRRSRSRRRGGALRLRVACEGSGFGQRGHPREGRRAHLLSAAYRTGATLLDVTPDGFEQVWASDEVLSNHYVSSIYHEGTMYGMHGRQPVNPSLRAVDPETGEILWAKRRFGTGQLLLAGSTLIVMRETGELTLVDATAEEYRELASAQIFESTVRAYPAIAGGVLYARDEQELIAVDLRPR